MHDVSICRQPRVVIAHLVRQYTLEAPYCLSSPSFLFEDCGSAGWAFALFISWNVISMYIVLSQSRHVLSSRDALTVPSADMFTGLVVENFAYVFQLYGKVKSISRDEVRGFKRVWAEFDRRGNGYLARSDYLAFFSVRCCVKATVNLAHEASAVDRRL